jgi:hypothetical protein
MDILFDCGGLHGESSVGCAPSLASDSEADSSDDDDTLHYTCMQTDAADNYFLQSIVCHKMQCRIANKFKLLEHVLRLEHQSSGGCAGDAQDECPSSYDGYNLHGDMAVWLAIYRQHEPHSKQDRDRSDARAQQARRTKNARAGLQDETLRPDWDPDSLV